MTQVILRKNGVGAVACSKKCGKLVSNATGVCSECRTGPCRGCGRVFISKLMEDVCGTCSKRLQNGKPLIKFIDKSKTL